MNSRTILKLLAALLVIVNIVLFFMVSAVYRRKYYIDADYMESTVSIFADEGIKIADGAIPKERFIGNIYSASLDEEYYEAVAGNITGETISTKFLTPGGYALTTETGKSLEFSEDYGFRYSVSADFSYDSVKADNSVSYSAKRRIEEKITDFLSAGDEGSYPSDLSLTEILYDEKTELYKAVAVRDIDGITLYGHRLSIILDKNENVIYAEGKWCFIFSSERYMTQIYDQVNILFIDKADFLSESGLSVLKVSPYYIIYSNDASSSVLLVPAWCIEYSDGTYRIYDAQNGNVAVTSEN